MTEKIQRAEAESGFTLFEILVGLAVSSLVMAGLVMAMGTINRGADTATAAIGRQSSLTAALHIVSGDVSRILRLQDQASEPRRFLFSGAPQETVFVLPERPGNNSAGLYWVRLQVNNTPAGTSLVRTRVPFVPGANTTEGLAWGDAVVLLEGPYALALSYRAPRAGLRNWAGNWLAANMMPEEIRIDVSDPATGLPIMPVVVETLKITAEAACTQANGPGCTLTSNGSIEQKVPQP